MASSSLSSLHHVGSSPALFSSTMHMRRVSFGPVARGIIQRKRFGAVAEVGTTEERADKSVVQSGNDRLEICRVINGMWQTSGGWGKIERDQAVGAMLRHVDAGFNTFDMADHCKYVLQKSLPFSSSCALPVISEIVRINDRCNSSTGTSKKVFELVEEMEDSGLKHQLDYNML